MKSTSLSQQAGDTTDTRKLKRSIGIHSYLTKYVYRSEFLWYFIGVIVRIIWTVVYPQRGYIHPVRKNIYR
jgi:hypothetical protein